MNFNLKIKVDDEIELKEIDRNDATLIFGIIDREREYLQTWLPFIEFTHDVSYTQQFVDNYVDSDRIDLTCGIYFHNQFVGLIGLKDTDTDNQKTEIGYWLSESFQGKGIVTRACKALIKFLFEKRGINRIQITVATENVKSKRIPERLGFHFEGIAREGELHERGFVDLAVYSLLKKSVVNS